MYIYADVNIYMRYTCICVPHEYTGYMHMYIYADILFVWYTYICVYIYMCTPRMYTHIYADIHIYMCTSRNQAIEIFTDEYKSIYVNIQGTCICIYTRIYTYICVYMCMQIYTYICVYMCVYMRIYIPPPSHFSSIESLNAPRHVKHRGDQHLHHGKDAENDQ